VAVVFEPLDRRHDRSGFSSGAPALDDWFRRRAGQDERRDVAHTFVAVDETLGVVGFYCISAYAIAFDALPDPLSRSLPRYDEIPAALIGRLARDERVRGRGIGERLLVDALQRIVEASRTLASFAIVVDAKDDRAAAFYAAYGFRPFPSRPNRLFLPRSTAAAALAAASDAR